MAAWRDTWFTRWRDLEFARGDIWAHGLLLRYSWEGNSETLTPRKMSSISVGGTPSVGNGLRGSSVELFEHLFATRDDALFRELYYPGGLRVAPAQSEELLVLWLLRNQRVRHERHPAETRDSRGRKR